MSQLTAGRINKQTVSMILGGLTSVYIGICSTAHTFLLHQYQDLFQAYEQSKKVSMSEELEQRYRQVLEDLNSDDADKDLSKVFMSIRPEPHHIGLSGSKYSFRIGLPLKFAYKSPQDINPNMKIESKYVDFGSEEGNLLRESLVLSEKAQKFAMGHEVLQCDMVAYYLQLTYPTVGCFAGFFLGNKGYEMLQLYKKPFQARIVFFTGISIFSYGLYILLKDKTQTALEEISLTKLSALGRDYIEGGIEYFEKQLKINKALRKLLHDGESTYAVTGNLNFFIRQKTLPLTYQRAFLEKKLKLLEEEKEELVEPQAVLSNKVNFIKEVLRSLP
uniref:Transmembrane protein 177 n=2 Tax=Cacopsylla melanoneura TaxID=428564 RepID=A0A8D8WCZ2_9HEMI